MPFKPKYCTQILPTETKCTNLATHILKLGHQPVSSDTRVPIYLCITCLQTRVATLPDNQFTLTKIPLTESKSRISHQPQQPRSKPPATPKYTPKYTPEQLKLLREQFERTKLQDRIRLRQEIIEYFGIDPLDLPF